MSLHSQTEKKQDDCLLGSNHSNNLTVTGTNAGGLVVGLAVGWVAANQWLLLRRFY